MVIKQWTMCKWKKINNASWYFNKDKNNSIKLGKNLFVWNTKKQS
jgi:hypothetical protein